MKASLLFLLACTAVLAVGASKGQRGCAGGGVGAQGAGGHTRGAHTGGTAAGPRPPSPTRLVLAGADKTEEPKALVQKVQELAQKATAMAKDAFSRVRDSEAAQQARCPRTPPALSLSLSPSPGGGGEPGQGPALTPCPPLPSPPCAGSGSRTARSWRSSGWCGSRSSWRSSGRRLRPRSLAGGCPGAVGGWGPPGSHPLSWCSQ